MAFLNDLKVGKDFEEEVKDKLNSLFLLELWTNDVKTWIDLISLNNWLKVEVKFDRRMRETWNIFIEYSCNWKDSWVFKYENDNSLLVYWDNESAYVFKLSRLQELVLEWKVSKEFKLINGWDGWKVKWVLVPINRIESFAEATIIFNQLKNGKHNLCQTEESTSTWQQEL